MKVKVVFICIALLGAACRSPAPPPPADGGDAQRLVSLLDYVGSDYARAVVDGAVVSDFEYDEQKRFVADARGLGADLLRGSAADADPLLAALSLLEERVSARAEAAAVRQASQAARDLAVRRFALRTAPTARPNLERARAQYAQSCAVCHGPTGDGDTERARSLDPAPARFRDPERLLALSPYRVYNALTFGVQGTGMASFDTLTPAERWDLAFYVFRLGHEGDAARPAKLPLADLAGMSNAEVLATLRSHGEAEPEAALAHLRRETPFEAPPAGATAALAQRLVVDAVGAFAAGERERAQRLAIDAYLQGFEPLEPELQARDPQGVTRIESAFGALRAAMAEGDGESVRARGEELQALLFEVAEGGGSRRLPFVAALIIYFREGIEAALLVGALLATLRKLGRADAARWVHGGWLLALPAGLLTYWLLDRVLLLSMARRELVEAVIALLAAGVLFSVSFWLISRAESRQWLGYLRRSVEAGLSSRSLGMLGGIAFLAVYREAAETVLFTQALLLAARGSGTEVALGALAGALLAALAALLMNRTVLRLPIGPFFAVSGALLTLLAISFAGAGVYGLVQAGYLSARPIAGPELPWIGIHPDLSAVLVQLAIVGGAAWAGIATLLRRGADAA
jgi:high-affinity iron transporter